MWKHFKSENREFFSYSYRRRNSSEWEICIAFSMHRTIVVNRIRGEKLTTTKWTERKKINYSRNILCSLKNGEDSHHVSTTRLTPKCSRGTTVPSHHNLIKGRYDADSDTFIRGIYFSDARISLPRDARGCTKFPFSTRFTAN